jgi:hypothetical protein
MLSAMLLFCLVEMHTYRVSIPRDDQVAFYFIFAALFLLISLWWLGAADAVPAGVALAGSVPPMIVTYIGFSYLSLLPREFQVVSLSIGIIIGIVLLMLSPPTFKVSSLTWRGLRRAGLTTAAAIGAAFVADFTIGRIEFVHIMRHFGFWGLCGLAWGGLLLALRPGVAPLKAK